MRRMTRRGAALALTAGLAAGPAAAVPAAAHGGEIDVGLGTDGGGGISATLEWARDGHPVEESAVVVVRATSDDGEQVGPVRLVSAPEGVGWYRSEAELLGEGHWTVTALVKEPERARVETELDVVAPPEPEASEATGSDAAAPAADGGDVDADAADGGAADKDAGDEGGGADGADAGGADGADAAARSEDPSSAGGPPGWTGWALGLLAAGAVATVVVVRRRRRDG